MVLLASTDATGRCRCGEKACPTPGKHLLNFGATRSPDVVRDWFRRRPRANLGITTGPENGLVVLDVDPADGGERSLRALPPLPPTLEVRTGGGGRHLYFRRPGSGVPSRNGWRPGIDVRGDGGYVVVPPSLHASGRRYAWAGASTAAPLPPRLEKLLSGPEGRLVMHPDGGILRGGAGRYPPQDKGSGRIRPGGGSRLPVSTRAP